MYTIIRRKDNPLKIKAYAQLISGDLGAYDELLYEQVTLEALPEGFSLEAPPKNASEVLDALRALFKGLPLSEQYQFRQPMAEVVGAAQGGNVALMRYIVEQLALPAELEPLRSAMLAAFE